MLCHHHRRRLQVTVTVTASERAGGEMKRYRYICTAAADDDGVEWSGQSCSLRRSCAGEEAEGAAGGRAERLRLEFASSQSQLAQQQQPPPK
ncbi:hypothetical protein ACLKA7_003273 [Drosophila subpalustris]